MSSKINLFNKKYNESLKITNYDTKIRWKQTIFTNKKDVINSMNEILKNINIQKYDNKINIIDKNINFTFELNNNECINQDISENDLDNFDTIDYIIYDEKLNTFAYWIEKCIIK